MQARRRIAGAFIAALLGAGAALPAAAAAVETITAGGVGSPQATSWPYYIGIDKGYFAAAGVALDFVYAASASGILQQLAAGSLDIVATTGLAEPVHANDKGAPVAVLRIIGQVSPYAVLAQKSIHSFKDLKGHTLSIGGLADITRLYLNRIMAAEGLKTGDLDILVIGATGPRLSALQSGAVDASMLVPPYSFHAEAEGYPTIARVIGYAPDLPFTGIETTRAYGAAHAALLKGLVKAFGQSVAWFEEDAHRAEAIQILAHWVKLDPGDLAKSYDFLRRIGYFARDDAVSRGKLASLIAAMQGVGDVGPTMTVDRLILPDVTQTRE